MICYWCGDEIRPFGRYLTIGFHTMCERCVEDNMEEYDPEMDEIDMKTDELIERRMDNGNTL